MDASDALTGDHDWAVLIVLAIVQGIAEFLPISSSGHLVILSEILGRDVEMLDLSIVLHLGTLGSILIYYWRRIVRLLGDDRRTIGRLIVATIPAVAVGLPIKKYMSHSLLENPLLAGCLLPVTGLVLLWASRRHRGERPHADLTWGEALAIGAAQAVAVLPGISRSGLTISAGLIVGLAPRSAAVFAFLMAIPAIGGAGLLEGLSLLSGAELVTPWEQLAVGALCAMMVGWVALWLLDRVLGSGRFEYFAAWVIPVGIAYVAWKILGRLS